MFKSAYYQSSQLLFIKLSKKISGRNWFLKVLLYFQDPLAVKRVVASRLLSFGWLQYFLFVLLDNKRTNAIGRRDWYVDGTRSRYVVGIFFRFSSDNWIIQTQLVQNSQEITFGFWVLSVGRLVGNEKKLVFPGALGWDWWHCIIIKEHLLCWEWAGILCHQQMQRRESWSS